MKKLLFYLFVGLMFIGCAKELGVENAQKPEDLDPMSISVEEALSEMYDLMEGLYGPDTRASKRTVADVNTYKTPLYLTRGTGEEATELAYIVNFAEGGFSVLSARRGTPSVWCVTEAGEFTPEEVDRLTRELEAETTEEAQTRALEYDYNNVTDEGWWVSYRDVHNFGYATSNPETFNVSDYNIDWDPGETQFTDNGEYLINSSDDSFIKRELLRAAGSGLDDPNDGIDDDPGEGIYTIYGPWTNNGKIGPLLTTKWRQQGSGFNDFCFTGGLLMPAGCVAIALAQIVAFNEKPTTASFSYNGIVTSTWAEIKSYPNKTPYLTSNPTVQARIRNDLARIIRSIGSGVNMRYSSNGSGATDGAAKRFLRKKGYRNVDKKNGYKVSHVESMLSKRLPVYIGGQKKGNAHAWVIDGKLYQKRSATTYDKDGNIIHTDTVGRDLYHCNFGWGGTADGYYVSNVFDPSKGPVVVESGMDNGSTNATAAHYKNWIKIIKYDK